jgi:hypothetical protein
MEKEQLLKAWEEIPELQRLKISKRGAKLSTASNYFNLRTGVKLTMQSLREIANAPERQDEGDTSGAWEEDGAAAGAAALGSGDSLPPPPSTEPAAAAAAAAVAGGGGGATAGI